MRSVKAVIKISEVLYYQFSIILCITQKKKFWKPYKVLNLRLNPYIFSYSFANKAETKNST